MYNKGCALFAVMHIHSAITGKYYHHPDEFVNELKTKGLSDFFYDSTWPGKITRIPSRFEDLGYRTEVRGNYAALTSQDYQYMAEKLTEGAYIYTQVSTMSDNDGGHAVVIYGINDEGEVCVLDSSAVHEQFGIEPNPDLYTYTIPFQNIVGADSDFIIVYPPNKKSFVDWTNCVAANTFTSASLPSEYPENQVTTCFVTNDIQLPSPHQGMLTAYRGRDYAYRTFVPHGQGRFYVQTKSPDEGDNNKWLEWTEFNSTSIDNASNNGDTSP